MKYFHRTSVSPDAVAEAAARYFGARMQPTDEHPRHRAFSSAMGQVTVTAEPEGGHYTLVVVATNQPGESELDKFAKRFLGTVHTMADQGHVLRGAY